MSKCTLRNIDFLKHLCKRNRKKSIAKATSDNIRAVSEIAHNALKGKIKFPPSSFKKLKKYKANLKRLASKVVSDKKKKQVLLQRGGFLPLLIPPVLSIAGTLAGRYLAKELGL